MKAPSTPASEINKVRRFNSLTAKNPFKMIDHMNGLPILTKDKLKSWNPLSSSFKGYAIIAIGSTQRKITMSI